jgi:hypothetical protein
MRSYRSLLAVAALAIGLGGCSNYYYLGSSDADCFPAIRSEDSPFERANRSFLRWWQSSDYCRRLREEFARSFLASLPDFGVLRPRQQVVVGNIATFLVGVRNESMNTASPDFDVLIEAWVGVVPPAAPTFTTTQRYMGLAPQAENRTTVDVPVPTQGRPIDVLLRVTRRSAGGHRWGGSGSG